jgi:competence protein ComEA
MPDNHRADNITDLKALKGTKAKSSQGALSFSRGEQLILILLIISIAVGSLVSVIKKTRVLTLLIPTSYTTPRDERPLGQAVTVFVNGAVKKPHTYTLPERSRVFDSLLAAGGTLHEADLDGLNLVAPLQDKTLVEVPYREGTSKPEEQTEPAGFTRTTLYDMGMASSRSKPPPLKEGEIDLNSASQDELDRLPKIGPALAARIIEHRKAKGPFRKVEDLTQVRGIGEATLSEIRKYLRVETSHLPETTPSPSSEARAESTPSGKAGALSKVDINRASVEELTKLPKVGPAMARRIIEHRTTNGPFRKVEDLTQVKGIGPKTFDELKDLITAGSVDDQ